MLEAVTVLVPQNTDVLAALLRNLRNAHGLVPSDTKVAVAPTVTVLGGFNLDVLGIMLSRGRKASPIQLVDGSSDFEEVRSVADKGDGVIRSSHEVSCEFEIVAIGEGRC